MSVSWIQFWPGVEINPRFELHAGTQNRLGKKITLADEDMNKCMQMIKPFKPVWETPKIRVMVSLSVWNLEFEYVLTKWSGSEKLLNDGGYDTNKLFVAYALGQWEMICYSSNEGHWTTVNIFCLFVLALIKSVRQYNCKLYNQISNCISS